MLASMTALEKTNGGVRGIATGTSFRRLASKTLGQFSQNVEEICVPFQFVLSTSAGTDCVGLAIKAATEADPRLTVLSIEFRSTMLSKLLEVPSLRNLIPFARVAHAQPNSHVWEDADGVWHNIEHHEEGETR